MEITLVGTGSPVPIPERGGTSIALDIADRDLESMQRDAEAVFDGEVIVAEDGLSISL